MIKKGFRPHHKIVLKVELDNNWELVIQFDLSFQIFVMFRCWKRRELNFFLFACFSSFFPWFKSSKWLFDKRCFPWFFSTHNKVQMLSINTAILRSRIVKHLQIRIKQLIFIHWQFNLRGYCRLLWTQGGQKFKL